MTFSELLKSGGSVRIYAIPDNKEMARGYEMMVEDGHGGEVGCWFQFDYPVNDAIEYALRAFRERAAS